ncbi:hypothetical protein TWF718_008175 [Orbilia javanica]|uniref:Uncharacterized protein n=1 Tax=Orbilia javanica TaxID=47235 RepID=A0AAN8NTS3_9PEZI
MRLSDFLRTALAVPVAGAIAPAPQCTTVLRVAPHLDLSPTKTVYQTTVTAYNRVDCDGCVLKTEYLPFGPGPVSTFPVPINQVVEY